MRPTLGRHPFSAKRSETRKATEQESKFYSRAIRSWCGTLSVNADRLVTEVINIGLPLSHRLQVDSYERLLSQFLLHHRSKYSQVKVIAPHEHMAEAEARNLAV